MSRRDWVQVPSRNPGPVRPQPKPAPITKKPKAPPAPKVRKLKALSPSSKRVLEGETLHLFPTREKGGQTRIVALPIGNGKRLFGVQHLMPRPDGTQAPFGWVNFNEEEAQTLALVLAAFLKGGAE